MITVTIDCYEAMNSNDHAFHGSTFSHMITFDCGFDHIWPDLKFFGNSSGTNCGSIRLSAIKSWIIF